MHGNWSHYPSTYCGLQGEYPVICCEEERKKREEESLREKREGELVSAPQWEGQAISADAMRLTFFSSPDIQRFGFQVCSLPFLLN